MSIGQVNRVETLDSSPGKARMEEERKKRIANAVENRSAAPGSTQREEIKPGKRDLRGKTNQEVRRVSQTSWESRTRGGREKP